MSSPEETRQAADLIERLLTDAAFRAEFRRDPATACEQLRARSSSPRSCAAAARAKALYTLELRQSMSSLAGVIMAAAAEGIGALELAGFGSEPGQACGRRRQRGAQPPQHQGDQPGADAGRRAPEEAPGDHDGAPRRA